MRKCKLDNFNFVGLSKIRKSKKIGLKENPGATRGIFLNQKQKESFPIRGRKGTRKPLPVQSVLRGNSGILHTDGGLFWRPHRTSFSPAVVSTSLCPDTNRQNYFRTPIPPKHPRQTGLLNRCKTRSKHGGWQQWHQMAPLGRRCKRDQRSPGQSLGGSLHNRHTGGEGCVYLPPPRGNCPQTNQRSQR